MVPFQLRYLTKCIRSDPFSYSIWHGMKDLQLQLPVVQTAVTDKPPPSLCSYLKAGPAFWYERGDAAGQRQVSQPGACPWAPRRDLCGTRCCLKKLLLDLRVVPRLEDQVALCLASTRHKQGVSAAELPSPDHVGMALCRSKCLWSLLNWGALPRGGVCGGQGWPLPPLAPL